jgi:cell division transport system ATP-binding protein
MERKIVAKLQGAAIYHAENPNITLTPRTREKAGEKVLENLDLEVAAGEVIYLIGRVGSGKSSLLKTIYGELSVDGTKAMALDYNLLKLRRREIPYLRRKVGVVFQDFQLLVDRNVEENLMFVLKATGWTDKQAMKNNIYDVLKQVGMEDKTYKMPYQLSGGEQQRVVIARALLNSPGLILADEPTGNLDPETGKGIMDLLYAISQAGMTVIMSTHNPMWPEQYPGRKLHFADRKITEL